VLKRSLTDERAIGLLLSKLRTSVTHLNVVHQFLYANYGSYKDMTDEIAGLGLEDFARELYAGGKVRNQFGRQMILGDIFQYLFIGRGYYAAVKNCRNMQKFIELLLRVANLLLLQENLSVRADLRKALIDELTAKIAVGEFIEPSHRDTIAPRLRALRKYRGAIIKNENEGIAYEDVFDSLLPKRLGLADELIVFAVLLFKRYGYVVPLLMSQRLIRGGCQRERSSLDYVAPPDFLVLRGKGESIGIEVGSQKDVQNTEFSLRTSIPVIAVRPGNHDHPHPFRCAFCREWILYAPQVIRDVSTGALVPDEESIEATKYFADKIPKTAQADLVFYGRAENRLGDVPSTDRRYHYNCVRDQEVVKRRVGGKTRHKRSGVVFPLPFIEGLAGLMPE